MRPLRRSALIKRPAARQQVTPVDHHAGRPVGTGSNALVTRVYMLEPRERARGLAPEVTDFTERVRFTASLYATAWKLSGTLQLPKAAAE